MVHVPHAAFVDCIALPVSIYQTADVGRASASIMIAPANDSYSVIEVRCHDVRRRPSWRRWTATSRRCRRWWRRRCATSAPAPAPAARCAPTWFVAVHVGNALRRLTRRRVPLWNSTSWWKPANSFADETFAASRPEHRTTAEHVTLLWSYACVTILLRTKIPRWQILLSRATRERCWAARRGVCRPTSVTAPRRRRWTRAA